MRSWNFCILCRASSTSQQPEAIAAAKRLWATSISWPQHPGPMRLWRRSRACPWCRRSLVKGPTKASVIVQETIQVDLRIVEHRSLGTVLQYFTGSKEHNVRVRQLSLARGYSLSEYSLTRAWQTGRIFSSTGRRIFMPIWDCNTFHRNCGKIGVRSRRHAEASCRCWWS